MLVVKTMYIEEIFFEKTLLDKDFQDMGIDFKRVFNMEIFGTKPQFAYAFQFQWDYIIKNKPKLDFIVTGISYVRDAFDVKTMEPWQGVNFSRDSQDLYYSYKMAEAYFKTIPPPS